MDAKTEAIIKAILTIRCREGTTVIDIENEYTEIVGRPWPFKHHSNDAITKYLSGIDNVYCVGGPNGSAKWFIQSSNSKHITEFIQQQKPTQSKRQYLPNQQLFDNPMQFNDIDCFFEDNLVYRKLRKRLKFDSCSISPIRTIPTQPQSKPIDAQYIGDDFFMALMNMDPVQQPVPEGGGIKQIGLCKSGLTIAGAIKLIENADILASRVIINVGSVDIMNDASLSYMCSQLQQLIRVCKKREAIPILTTIAPLANGNITYAMNEKLLAYNSFIFDTFVHNCVVIDIWSLMINSIGSTLLSLFNKSSEFVSGTPTPHVFWNQKGRKRVHNFIRKSLCTYLGKKRVFFGF